MKRGGWRVEICLHNMTRDFFKKTFLVDWSKPWCEEEGEDIELRVELSSL